jgi:hypothetical protein
MDFDGVVYTVQCNAHTVKEIPASRASNPRNIFAQREGGSRQVEEYKSAKEGPQTVDLTALTKQWNTTERKQSIIITMGSDPYIVHYCPPFLRHF